MEIPRYTAIVIFILICWTSTLKCAVSKHRIKVVNNGYEGVTIAISQKLAENVQYINKLQELFTAASAQLYTSTKYHLFFKMITIVIPKSWTKQPNYGSVSGPQFDMAHVVLDELNELVGSRPYVVGMTDCGAEAQYMHLEPYTIAAYDIQGFLDKAIVHQWGHLRWGLFNEYPGTESPILDNEKQFYFSEGTFKPNVCSKDVKGDFLKNCYNPQSKCQSQDGQPEPGCQFCPQQSSPAQASIMGYFYLDSTALFCDDSEVNSNQAEHHNAEAPTKQNRLCAGRSAWEVMRDHEDFSGLTPGSPTQDTTPTFTLVQQDVQKVVLVLDVSGSMNSGDRLQKLVQATTNYLLNVVDDETKVGVVTFNSAANIVRLMTPMMSDDVRQQYVNTLPTSASGGTSIGAGLRAGIKCLNDSGDTTAGSILLLVSDGDERTPPFIRDVQGEVEASGVVVMSLAFTEDADVQIAELASNTSGRSFFYSGGNDSTVLVDAFSQSVSQSADSKNALFLIDSVPFTVSETQPYKGNFIIDSSIGKDTTLSLSGTDLTGLSISASSPSLDMFTSGPCNSSSCRIRFPGISETGKYQFTVSSSLTTDSNVVCMIQSYQRSENAKVILINSWTSGTSLNVSSGAAIKLFASVMRGGAPILNATVKAVLDKTKDALTLLDGGFGADAQENDGVYSAFVLPSLITGDGRVSAKVTVTNDGGMATVLVPVTRRKRSTVPSGFQTTVQLTTASAGNFQRSTQAGEFTVTNYDVSNTGDNIPPARISTLTILSRDDSTREFRLQFRTVGDDFDVGTATSYDVRITREIDKLLKSPTTTFQITDNIPTPKASGEIETLVITLPNNSFTYFVGMRAMDDNGNLGELSNIVSLSIINDVQWLAPSTTTPGATTPTAKSPRRVTSDADVERESLIALIFSTIAAVCVLFIVTVTIAVIRTRWRDKERQLVQRKSRRRQHRSQKSSASSSRSSLYRGREYLPYHTNNGHYVEEGRVMHLPAADYGYYI